MSGAPNTVTMSNITDSKKAYAAFEMTCTKPSAWHHEAGDAHGDAIAYNIIRAYLV